MKNDQENSIFPSVPFSCMLEQLKVSELDQTNKWHFKCLIWSWHMNPWFIWTSFKLLLAALAQLTSYCHVMIMHHIVALHWLYSFCVCRWLFPPDRRGSDDWSMTPMKNYIIFRSARQEKPPCSFRYNPTLSLLLSFTALGQQRFNCYMLR